MVAMFSKAITPTRNLSDLIIGNYLGLEAEGIVKFCVKLMKFRRSLFPLIFQPSLKVVKQLGKEERQTLFLRNISGIDRSPFYLKTVLMSFCF